MNEISNRQKDLLLSIIREFIDTAEAVGSISLQNKYRSTFNLSSATIRNEMAELALLGYLYQKHMSSGRIPTTKAWRFFIDSLSSAGYKNIDPTTKSDIKTTLNKIHNDKDDLVRKSISYLSTLCKNAAVAIIDGDLYYAGLAELVNIPEFKDTNNLKKILTILEDYYGLSKIMNKEMDDDEVEILIGEETGNDMFSEYSVVFTEVRLKGKRKGFIAVIGPNRMEYDFIIPAIKFISNTVRDVLERY